MRFIFHTLVIILLFPIVGRQNIIAQNDILLDSLSRLLPSNYTLEDSNSFWLSQTEAHHLDNPLLAEACLHKYRIENNNLPSFELSALANYWTAWFLTRINPDDARTDVALMRTKIALAQFENQGNDLRQIQCYLLLAKLYIFDAAYDQAGIQLDAATKLFLNVPANTDGRLLPELYLYFTKASLCYQLNDTSAAKLWTNKGAELAFQQEELSLQILAHRNRIHFLNIKNIDSTLLEVELLLEDHEDEFLAGDWWQSVGDYFRLAYLSQLDDSLLHRSTDYYKRVIKHPISPKASAWFHIGRNYHYLAGQGSKEGISDNWQFAQTAYEKAMHHASIENYTRILALAIKNLAITCRHVGECAPLLFSTQTLYKGVLDSMSNIGRAAAAVEGIYEKQILQLKSKRRELQMQWGTGIIFLIGIGGIAYQWLRRRNLALKTENQLLESRVEALRVQVSPHFLSNNFNALEGHINMKRLEAAKAHIHELSSLSRLMLQHTQRKYISLLDELQREKHYLQLEVSGAGGDFSYTVDIHDEIDPRDWFIPPLLLNPFVENAILHGFRKKGKAGSVHIKILPKPSDHILCIVEDDGLGRNKVAVLQQQMLRSDRQSYGVTLAKEQLEKIPGSRFKIEDAFPDSKYVGTRVTIELPKLKQQ